MSCKNWHKVKLVFTWLVLLVIVTSTYSKNYYLHAHKLVNGTVIYHSHPYQKNSDSTPFKSHHHNHNQLVSIDQSDVLFHSATIVSKGSIPVVKLIRIVKNPNCLVGQTNQASDRAPPTATTC